MKIKIPLFLSLLLAGVMAQTACRSHSTARSPMPPLLLAGGMTHAAPPPITVAVFNFNSPSKGPTIRNNLAIATSLITANLSTNPCFFLVERTELQKILDEEAFGKSGNITPDTAAKIGQLTGAKVLVTGQFLLVSEAKPIGGRKVVIIANVIGTETGRVFMEKVEGVRSNEMALDSDLSKKIAQTITRQRTNLIADTAILHDKRIAQILKKIQGKQRPAVSVQIDEQFLNVKNPGQAAQTELGMIFKEAGFEVVDGKSDKKPEVLITGTAWSSVNTKENDGLLSCSATLTVKAQDRLTGKILSLDRQDSTAVDLNRQMAANEALGDAADGLAERLLPLLAK